MKSKSSQVNEQALFYVLSFVITFMWSMINRFLALRPNHGATPYAILVGNAFFDPLQGFINYAVFIRPRWKSMRPKYPNSSGFQLLKSIITHADMPVDEDKDIEDGAKEELSRWRLR